MINACPSTLLNSHFTLDCGKNAHFLPLEKSVHSLWTEYKKRTDFSAVKSNIKLALSKYTTDKLH